ncbi:hypothetical protein CF319_g3571 [Tilletia indica]|nr:hypothetical protein CF319_g3571 [Tilletia indica]
MSTPTMRTYEELFEVPSPISPITPPINHSPTLQDLPEYVANWAARLRNSEILPQDGRTYFKFFITNGHQHHRTIYKHENDMLWTELQFYTKEHPQIPWPTEALQLSVRGCPVDPYKPIGSMFLQNGDTIHISHSTSLMFTAEAIDRLRQLSPTDCDGNEYEDICGPLTRVDEAILRINFEDFWPHLPSVHIMCRAVDGETVEHLRRIISLMTNVPINQLRISQEGVRADGELGKYRVRHKIDLDVYLEQIGGGTRMTYTEQSLRHAPSKYPPGMHLLSLKHRNFQVELYTPGHVPLRHVVEFLQTHARLRFTLKHEDKHVKAELSLDELIQEGTIPEDGPTYVEVETIDKGYEMTPGHTLTGTFHLVIVHFYIEGAELVRPTVVPFGSTISNWWKINQGDPRSIPDVHNEAALIRGNPTIDQLYIDSDTVLEVFPVPRYPKVHHTGPFDEGRYKVEEYHDEADRVLSGYTTFKFQIDNSAVVAHLTPSTPIRALLNFLHREFGVSIRLELGRNVLTEEDTPLKLRTYGPTSLKAKLLYQVEEPLPAQVNIVATNFFPSTLGTAVYGVIAPMSATIPRVWERECRALKILDPRFLLDGDRIMDTQTWSSLDLDDDAYIEVAGPQIGGGPGIGDKRSFDEVDPDEEEEVEIIPNRREEVVGSSNPQHMVEEGEGAAQQQHRIEATAGTADTRYNLEEAVGTANPHFMYIPGDSNTSTSSVPVPTPSTTIVTNGGAVKHPTPTPFKGPGVKTFFKRYDAWCNTYNMTATKRFEGLYFYLHDKEPHNVLAYAQGLEEWDHADYEGVKKELLKAFEESEADKFTLTDLEAYIGRARNITTLQELNQFIIGFKEIANPLKKYRKISEGTYRDLFMKGLGSKVRDLMRRKDMEQRKTRVDPTFAEIEEDARDSFHAETYYEKYEYQAVQEEDRRLNPSHIRVPQLTLRTSNNPIVDKNDPDMKEVTEAIKNLTINMARYVNHQTGNGPSLPNQTHNNRVQHVQIQPWHKDSRTPAIMGNPPPPPFSNPYQGNPNRQANVNSYAAPPPRTQYQGDPNRQAAGTPYSTNPSNMTCHYCGDPAHGKRECTDYKSHLAQGVFLEGMDGRMLDKEGRRLPWRPGQMREIALLRYNEIEAHKSTPAANHYEMVFEDEEQEDDWPQTCECCNTYSSNNVIAEVNEKRKAREEDITPQPPATRSKTGHLENEIAQEQGEDTDDEEMVEGISIVKKKRRHPTHHVMSKVEEEFNLNGMATNLLEQGTIQLSIAQACSLNKDLAREVSKRIKPRRIPIIGPIAQNSELLEKASVHFSNNLEVVENGPFYTHGLPLLKVDIGGQTLKALLDGGSELDMISLDAAKRISAAVRNDGNHKVFGIGTMSVKLLGVLENVEISIGGITRTVHLWVRPGLNYDMLLGMPTIARFNLRQERAKDGLVWVRLKDNNGRKVKMLAVQANHPKNRTYLPPKQGEPTAREERSEDSDSSDD